MHWSAAGVSETATTLESDASAGLDPSDAAFRLARDGPNLLPTPRSQSWLLRLLRQFSDVMVLVLLAAAVIAALIGEVRDAAMIALILILNALIGFTQEQRATRAVAALKQFVSQRAGVIRGGSTMWVDASDLVMGDLVIIKAGDLVPADLRLVAVQDIEVDEAPLTGESHTVTKSARTLPPERLALGDQVNMAFRGTLVTRGSATGLVVAIGAASEIGKIAGTLQTPHRISTPLQRRLARVSQQLAVAAVAICAIIFVAGLLRDHPPLVMLMTAASVAVASMPEALPAVVTVLLAIGARKMARHNALIRRLPAVETLGSVTYICTDKTGTLTENSMRVTEVRSERQDELLTAMALCNDVDGAGTDDVRGEPTELALAAFARQSGYDRCRIERDMPRVKTFAFSSERKRMTTVHRARAGYVAYMKGAPEVLLEFHPELRREAGAMACLGLRVLAFARQMTVADAANDEINADIEILGLVGLMDPPRAEAPAAIAACKTAGIVPVMITGDHPQTAEAIAQQIGLVEGGGETMSGRDIAALDDAEFSERVLTTHVYARVDPAQKIRIVEALQAKGQFVAMTGDGVNDAPALSRADIGVAMGRIGTDVAREAASLVLLDDNFASIVYAVREGRRIFDNIQKFIRYVLACNLAEVLVVFCATLAGLPLPLLPLQILWINLVTDGLPGLALAGEPAEPDIMKRPPHPPQHGLFDRRICSHIAIMGTFMAAVTIGTQIWALEAEVDNWQTMVFTVLTFLQLGQAVAVRSENMSLFALKPFGNPALAGAIALTIVLHLGVVYTVPGNRLFHTAPLSAEEISICIALSFSGLAFSEILKLLTRIKTSLFQTA